jgi:hypothetical protein
MSGVEARRWSIVFHRDAENWFFAALACGTFKHVSAFAFVPGPDVWVYYDVGFRRTRLVVLPDNLQSKLTLAAIVEGNAVVSMPRQDDNLPLMRLGLFCTTAVKHLVGIRCSALRPDALFRHCMAHGGALSDDEPETARSCGRHEPQR